ncbi:MAG TPA: hypothetical protein VMI73_15870 [Trebonia sp.]|nr:hypothetical protein [Trebonia sp.]
MGTVSPAVPGCVVALPVPLLVAAADGVLLELLHAATVRDNAASPALMAITERAVRRCLDLLMSF